MAISHLRSWRSQSCRGPIPVSFHAWIPAGASPQLQRPGVREVSCDGMMLEGSQEMLCMEGESYDFGVSPCAGPGMRRRDLEPRLHLMEFNGTVTFWRNYFYKSVKHLKDSNFQ